MTDQWNDAARKAADEILDMHSDFSMCPELKQGAIDESAEFIVQHFSDLKATHEKLVELAVAVKQAFDMRSAINLCRTVGMPANPEWEEKAIEAQNTIAKSVIDPLVVAAIERSKGNG